MKFATNTIKNFSSTAVDLVLTPVFEETAQSPKGAQLPKGFPGTTLATAKLEGFKGTAGQTFTMHSLEKDGPRAHGLIGAGKKHDLSIDGLRKLGAYAFKLGQAKRAKRIALYAPSFGRIESKEALQALAEGALLSSYRFAKYITEDKPEIYVEEITVVADIRSKEAASAFDHARHICTSVFLARDLINEGPLAVNPQTLAATAQKEGKPLGLEVEVLDEKALAKENMNLMLAVGRASTSAAPPRLIRIAYRPTKKAKRHVMLVGKGVTFDTGGLDLKPSNAMGDMKVDMSGAAATLGTMLAIAKLKPHVNVTAYMPCVENGIGAHAYHPGDVIKSRKGLSVEINNTDAEGRLILADALDYGQSRDNPDTIIDLATLTGAIIVALGPTMAGLFANNDKLAQQLIACGKRAGEDFWRMPLNEELSANLKSGIADMRQIGDRPQGGSILGALFLKKFVRENVEWAHLDIAGPATTEKDHPYNPLGGTGFAVRTLVKYLCD